MTITIEGCSVVAKKECVMELVEAGKIQPSGRHIADDHLWRCSFMTEADARRFLKQLDDAGLNTSQGPDSDVVIVDEFKQEVEPYCEWIQLAPWEKAVLAWKVGTDPKKLIAHEGFDPKVGSGLIFRDRDSEDLEFLRLDGNIEVYFDKKLGKEVYIGHSSPPVEATFKHSCDVIRQHFRTAGENPLVGEDAEHVDQATKALGLLLEEHPNWWQALFFQGKGLIALGKHREAFLALSRAFDIEKDVEPIPRELGGVCLELGKFGKAVECGERAVSLQPDDAGSLGNLGLSYLLAERIDAARRALEAALRINPQDAINRSLLQIVEEVESGLRPQPNSLRDLQRSVSKASTSKTTPTRKRPWWKFW
ncbi:MAG: hypothetical protein AAFX06_23620 [Planctomycetota bacterium]